MSLNTYEIEITETFKKTIEIKAVDEREAFQKAESLYDKKKHILNKNDWKKTHIEIFEIFDV